MTSDRTEALLGEAERATREGRPEDAKRHYRAVLQLTPDQPRALNALGNRALSEGDSAQAIELFRRAVAVDPHAAPLWLNLAFACRSAGLDAEELQALERALIADPYFIVALLNKAQWFDRHGRVDEAVRTYRALLDAVPPSDQLPAPMRAALERGRTLVREADERVDAAIRAALGPREVRSERFLHCLDVLAGRRKIYVNEPAGLHFPYLPAIQFFDRSLFPWFAELEAATEIIRKELLALVRDGTPNTPYVRVAPGQPVNQWAALNNSLDWGALFLWKDGTPNDEMIARCPRSAAIMRRLPLLDEPGRSPTVMFSTLKPHTRIPPHTGVTNTRAVVHLPLIVPPHCAFRVGSETREWREGTAWAFDDTIEHEAWNDSDENRVILIVDAWNPYLDEEERELLRLTGQVLARPGMGVVTREGA